jgi:CRISPR/Cas system CMR-associated protein Cmr5 small subunit
MTLQFFASKPSEADGKRYRAVNTVAVWLWNRNHLPKDLVEALHGSVAYIGLECR